MDRGIWATWYDLPEQGKQEHLSWLHERYIPRMLTRSGYLWAAHVENLMPVERETAIHRRLVHTEDPAIGTGNQYLLLFGAPSPTVFVAPTSAEMTADLAAYDLDMLGRRAGTRSCTFLEVERVAGPEVKQRAPGLTPGPVVQLGTFNINSLQNEDELNAWYTRSRLPLMAPMPGCVGARKLVTISGWAKHAILYEFTSLELVEKHFQDTSEWTEKVIKNLIHAPHSPSIGVRIWPR